VPKLYDEYLRKMSVLNVVFAAASLGLLLVLVWMVADDYARGWKGYQKTFARLESQKAEQALKEAEEKVNQDDLKKLEGDLAQARAVMSQHAADRRSTEETLRRIATENYRDDLVYRTFKSTYDARRFDYEEAREHGDPGAPALYKTMQELERSLQEYDVRLKEEEKAKAAAEAALKAIVGKTEDLQKQIDDLTAGLSRVRKRLEKVAPRGLMRVAVDMLNAPLLDFMAPTIRIQQAVLNGMPIDINFTSIPRADRCQTCHLAADRKGFEDAPEPFRTHPRLDLFVGGSSPHPIDRFGCTPCHGGRDRAVEFVYAAHTPDTPEQRETWEKTHGWEREHLWDYPMLARSRTEAGCLKCHQGVARVPEAPRLDRGIALVERSGCFGCHKIRGFTDLRKIGPPLVRITSKTNPEWLARWIKNPKAFRPSTRMPRLFGLENNREPGDAEREDAEVIGIVAYLTEKAEKISYPPLPGRGDPGRGERLVKTVGCMGCHAIERDEVKADALQARNRGEAPDPVAWERRFGPDLSRVGSKARPEWIYQWIRNPKASFPETRMPNLRLSEQEALDITAYLMTLKDESPAEARVVPPKSQPESRDATLLAYLSQRLPPEDARQQIERLSGRQRDVLLGERTIARYGCFGCHLIPGFETTPAIGTDLSEEGSKHPDLLFFGYVPIEHTSPAWFFEKLKEPRSFDRGKVARFYDRLRMPQFGFTDEEAQAITIVLQGLTREKMPLESVRRLAARDQAVEEGRKIVRDFNCQGCHILDGSGGAIRESIARNLMAEGKSEDEARTLAPSFAPPILEGEGSKVQPDWLFRFLKGPTPIRPWLQVRMPTFGLSDQQANTLVHHFAARDRRDFPFQTLDQQPPAGGELQAALKMFGPDYFNCWNCHQKGAQKPPGPPEGWAPDLMLAHERLNPDWIARWIENPQKLMPGTRMPTFYDPEDPKGSAPPDVLGGDPARQIQALRDYVFTLGLRRAGASRGAQP
jgi:cbb3-type cytochrome oxidase cytochrome c subunit